MQNNEQFHFFFQNNNVFSQWFPATFTIDNIIFNCTEQYMMYKKAQLFKDKEIMKQILKSTKPNEQKALGRKVKNFDETIWNQQARKIVYDGNYAKFTQNPELLNQLLNTKGFTLVEASPFDKIWGIGLSANDSRAKQRKLWKGTNWLGETLTLLRENLLNENNNK